MKVLHRGQIFEGQADSRTANSCFPSLCRFPDGTLLASWRVGSGKDTADGTIYLSRSHDNGATWESPESPFSNPLPDHPGTYALNCLSCGRGATHDVADLIAEASPQRTGRSGWAGPSRGPVMYACQGSLPRASTAGPCREGGCERLQRFTTTDSTALQQGGCTAPHYSKAVTPPSPQQVQAVPGELHYAALTALNDTDVLAAIMWLDRTDPDRPMFNDQTEGLTTVHTLLSISHDQGLSWGTPWVFDAGEYHGLASVCAPTLKLPDGRLALQFETNKPYDSDQVWQQRACLRFSDDGGRTWANTSVVAHDPQYRIRYWDQRHALAPDGTLLAGLWVFDSVSRKELNFHLTESTDGGCTWSQPWDSGLDYQLPYPVFLPDGRLVMFVIDRYRSRTIRALLSGDRGRSFDSDEIEIHCQCPDRRDAGEFDHKLSDQQLWSFGRLEAITVDDQTLAGVFYAGDSSRTSIHYFLIDVGS